MKRTVLATYTRKSTLWKNANAFYVGHDWTKMECIFYDYSEELEEIYDPEYGIKWFDSKGNDVTEREVKKRYGKPYVINFTNVTGRNSKSYCFETKDEANAFFKRVMTDRVLGTFKKI